MRRILPLGVLLFALCAFPASAILDSNENGLSDLWEMRYNNGTLPDPGFDPLEDPDADGWNNAKEAAAGTNPFDANPPDGHLQPLITHIPEVWVEVNGIPEQQSPVAITLTWPTITGKQYTLLVSPDLSTDSWLPVEEEGFTGNGNDSVYTFTLPQDDKLFWRVAINDVDSNGDGLTDAEEATLGTGPNNSDSDSDGLPDWWEVVHGFNPTVNDSADLFPGSTLTRLEAYTLGVQANPNATPDNLDGDDLPNDQDADPNDRAINWKRAPESSYIILPLANAPIAGTQEIIDWTYRLGEGGHVLASRDSSCIWWGSLYPEFPTGAPETEYYETRIWNPDTTAWTSLTLPDNLRGTGSSVDLDGNVFATGYGALGPNASSPGIMPVTFWWQKNQTAWNAAVLETGTFGPQSAFSDEDTTMLSIPWPLDMGDNARSTILFGTSGRFNFTCQLSQAQGASTTKMNRLIGGTTENLFIASGQSTNSTYILHKALGEPLGWHFVSWKVNTTEKDIFGKLEAGTITPFTQADPNFFANTAQIASINSALLPATISNQLIQRNNDGTINVGTNHDTSGVLTWITSTQTDPAKRIGGKINARAEGLDTSNARLWRNGKWNNLSALLPSNSGWSEVDAYDINSQGSILIMGTHNGQKEMALLLPVEVRVRQAQGYTGPHGSKSLYQTPRPENGEIKGEVFSLWENEEAYITIGGIPGDMIENGTLPENSVKWSAPNHADVIDQKEFNIKWTATGQKEVNLTLVNTTILVHFTVPDVGSIGKNNPILLVDLSLTELLLIMDKGEAVRNAVDAKYGTTGATGGARQDAIRHSTWTAVVANILGLPKTLLASTANEYTGKVDASAISSNSVMDMNNNFEGATRGNYQFGQNLTMQQLMDQMEALYDAGNALIKWIPDTNTVQDHHGMLRWSTGERLFNE